jgi:hypothetical protein
VHYDLWITLISNSKLAISLLVLSVSPLTVVLTFAGLIENGSDLTVDAVDEVSKSLKDDTNIFSQVYWNTKKAFAQLQELIRGIFDTAEQRLQVTDDDDDFFQHTVRSTMMLSVLVMSLVVFKRSAAHSP